MSTGSMTTVFAHVASFYAHVFRSFAPKTLLCDAAPDKGASSAAVTPTNPLHPPQPTAKGSPLDLTTVACMVAAGYFAYQVRSWSARCLIQAQERGIQQIQQMAKDKDADQVMDANSALATLRSMGATVHVPKSSSEPTSSDTTDTPTSTTTVAAAPPAPATSAATSSAGTVSGRKRPATCDSRPAAGPAGHTTTTTTYTAAPSAEPAPDGSEKGETAPEPLWGGGPTAEDAASCIFNWGTLSGYQEQKALLEEQLLLPLMYPNTYRQAAQVVSEVPFQPQALLFEGPPGTGKTSFARRIAELASVPLVYLPLESFMSKWVGESEKNLSKAFKAIRSLGGGILFLDEIDVLGRSRDSTESSLVRTYNSVLSCLLQAMDGFAQSEAQMIVVGATNRRGDIDSALLSRFGSTIPFPVPDEDTRVSILRVYARHLAEADLRRLARDTQGLAGRELRSLCTSASSLWTSQQLRAHLQRARQAGALAPPALDSATLAPPLDSYLAAAKQLRTQPSTQPAAAARRAAAPAPRSTAMTGMLSQVAASHAAAMHLPGPSVVA